MSAASQTAVSHLSLYGQWTSIECSCSRGFHLLQTSALEMQASTVSVKVWDICKLLRGCDHAHAFLHGKKFYLLDFSAENRNKINAVNFIFFTHIDTQRDTSVTDKIDSLAICIPQHRALRSTSFQHVIVLSETSNNYWYRWRIGWYLESLELFFGGRLMEQFTRREKIREKKFSLSIWILWPQKYNQ